MRILVADDNLISRKVLVSSLEKNGYEVIVTETGEEAFDALCKPDAPRLAILDWMMPDLTGLEICKRVRALKGGEFYYLILLTSCSEIEDIVLGLKAGADDYLTKPFDSRELKVRLCAGQRMINLQQELVAARDELAVKAMHDPLTGVHNHGAIHEYLNSEIQRSIRKNYELSIMMIDLDHFKKINDTFGHVEGDFVLREIASRIKNLCRSYDLVGRYGGEEFLVVLPETSLANAQIVAERISQKICSAPVNTGENNIPVSASIGAARMQPCKPIAGVDFIKIADSALYEAKQAGRNCIKIA